MRKGELKNYVFPKFEASAGSVRSIKAQKEEVKHRFLDLFKKKSK